MSGPVVPQPGSANPDLLKAIKDKDFTAVSILLVKNHVPAGGADQYGYTPLYLAVQNGSDDIVQALLKAGANVHETTYGREPFINAAGSCSLATVKLFMAKGAKVT